MTNVLSNTFSYKNKFILPLTDAMFAKFAPKCSNLTFIKILFAILDCAHFAMKTTHDFCIQLNTYNMKETIVIISVNKKSLQTHSNKFN